MTDISQTSIVNGALSRIGAALIDDIEEDSVQADTAEAIWDEQRDEVQADFPWTMCRVIQALAATTNDREDDWAYKYQWPTCLRLLRLWPRYGLPSRLSPIKYEIANGAIYTNEEYARARLIVRISDVTLWSPGFVNAFKWKLAHELVMPLAKEDRYLSVTLQAYEMAKQKAWQTDTAQEFREEPEAEAIAPWLAARNA